MTPLALEILDVSKDYRALRPLRLKRLAVGTGESVAILGFNQTSAEVFFNLVTGASLPDTGEVRLFGETTAAITDGEAWLSTLDRIGIVSDRAVLLEQLTVTQNLAMPFTLEVEPPPIEIRVRAERLAREVGLGESTWSTRLGATDAGVRARTRLGRAMAYDPKLLVLEHASATLAASESSAFACDVRRLAADRRIAVVAATADETFARGVAARVLVLDAASGELSERRRSRWFGRRLG